MILLRVFMILLLRRVEIEPQTILAENSEPCGGTITGELEGEITSPGYPENNYPPNQNCTFVVEAPLNYVIVYNGTFVDLEDQDPLSGLCLYDYVKIFDDSLLSSAFCGQQAIYLNATTTNKLKIEFISDFTTEKKGFQIRWHILNLEERPIQLSCSFDDAIPLCAGWSNENSDYVWHFTREHTPSANTGPVSDHTTGSAFGRYAYIEGSKTKRNTTAILQSPAILSAANTNQRCVRFWYHMFGSGVGGLTVNLKAIDGHITLIADFNGNKGDVWLEGAYTITLRSLMSTVSFEGRRGLNYMSDIALDDISITVGPCDGHERSLGGAVTVGPSLLPFSVINLTPSGCATNLEPFNCSVNCDVTCENFFDLLFSSSCQRACNGDCACPVDIPVFHEGRCIDFLLCPSINTIDNTTTVSPSANKTTSTKQAKDAVTSAMSSRTSSTAVNPATRPKLSTGKKEMIHEYLIQQFASAVLSKLAKYSKNN